MEQAYGSGRIIGMEHPHFSSTEAVVTALRTVAGVGGTLSPWLSRMAKAP